MSVISELQPANKAEVMVYIPYHQGSKRDILPRALSLYKQGALEGFRHIEGGEDIPFVATWYVSRLPGDLTRCQLQFDGNPELSYQVNLQNHEFMNYLIETIVNFERSGITDFPKSFYQRLLNVQEVS